jgi:hypothetical protein
MNFETVIDAWRKASKELGFEIQSPFFLTTGSERLIRFELMVEEFGSKLGTIILLTDDMTEFNTPEKYGYYCSALNPENYSEYRREHFVDTLNDWGYFGEKSKTPEWVTGKPCTE